MDGEKGDKLREDAEKVEEHSKADQKVAAAKRDEAAAADKADEAEKERDK